MIAELAPVFDPSRWGTFAFLTARIGGLMMLAPLWSMTAMPRSLRAALTVALALVLLPAVPRVNLPEATLALPLPIAMEGMVGLALGLAAAVLVQALALGGEVISLQMGLSLGPALAPAPDVQTTGVAQLQTLFGLLIYTAIGGHLMLLQALADSLRTLPPGSGFLMADARPVAAMLGTLGACALRASAPVMVALLLAHVGIALLGRAVPQLNAMMVSFPLTIAVGLLVLGASLPMLGGVVGDWVADLPSATAGALSAFAPGGGR